METDIGTAVDYDPHTDKLKEEEDSTPILDERYYYPEYHQPFQPYPQPEKVDILANIDKSTWIIAFAVFLLGFFMGKTMQPVILRYT